MLAVEYEFRPSINKVMLVLVGLALALLAGFRSPEVVRDYEAYQMVFDTIFSMDIPAIFLIYEPGLYALVFTVRNLFENNYVIVIMILFAFASIAIKLTSINKLAFNPYLVILFYFSHFFILHEMTQIRIGLASGIFLLSLPYYFRGNRFGFTGMILLGTLFHYSAIFYLSILFFNQRTFNYYFFIGVLILSVVFAYLRLPLAGILTRFNIADISSKLEIYVELGQKGYLEEIRVYNVQNLCNIFCSVYLLYLIPKRVLLSDRALMIFLKCNIISIFLLSFFSGMPTVAFRFSELFAVVSIFLFAYLIKYLPFSKWNILFLIMLAGLLFFNTISSGILNPYKIATFK